jgi:chaperone modulatory protein CbpM
MNSKDFILIEQFCVHHGIEATFISSLQQHGMIEIVLIEEKEYFSTEQLSYIEKIIRLHGDLNINLEGIDAILNLLHQIDDLKSQLLANRNKLDFFEKQ